MTESARALAPDAGWPALADLPTFQLFRRVDSSPRGLTEADAAERLRRFGENQPFRAADDDLAARIVAALRSPFVALLTCLGVVFSVLGDVGGAATVATMVLLTVALRLWQRTRSIRAIRSVRDVVSATVTVRRRASDDDEPVGREVALHDVVPGDVVLLRAGDVVPADLRIVSSTDLAVDQSALSGESQPVAKSAAGPQRDEQTPLVRAPTLCFAGTAVLAGTATTVVIGTGAGTYSSTLARDAEGLRPKSSVDRGVRAVGWTLVRFMVVMAPIVFAVSGVVNGVWTQAAMFAVAVAVGLTPEMLPVIVTTNLARGAARLAHEQVIVNRLNAIQDLGAMDVLCVDKSGTLTEDRIVYAHGADVTGRVNRTVDEFAYLAVHFQEHAHSRLDAAIVDLLAGPDMALLAEATYDKVDEVISGRARRFHTVVVQRRSGEHLLICKGEPDQVLARCSHAQIGPDTVDIDGIGGAIDDIVSAHHQSGMQVLAVAVKSLPARFERYREADENDLVLAGFVAFVDPVRDSAAGAVGALADHGVAVKILTGDSRTVAVHVATQVGVDVTQPLLGRQIDRLSEQRLRAAVVQSQVFAELTPEHKARIVAALRDGGHAVGFLGDGVNDVAALRVADAGIAADTATEVAKHAADLILLDKDLAVLARGVVEGRRTLANTMKYVRVTASSNFGNALSVLAASAFLPFLPILPIQLLVQNMLYDTAQLTLPWDRVDDDYLRRPRRWEPGGLVRFMLVFGTLSSLFDLATFGALWWIFDVGHSASTFQTGWFVEGLLTQLLVMLVLRARAAPWRGARAAPVVVGAAALAALVGVLLPASPLAPILRMSPLPATYYLWLIAVAVVYGTTAQLVQRHYLRSVGPGVGGITAFS